MTARLEQVMKFAAVGAQEVSAKWYARSINCRIMLVPFDPKQHTQYRAGFDIHGRLIEKATEHAERGRQEADDARSLLFELIDRKAEALYRERLDAWRDEQEA